MAEANEKEQTCVHHVDINSASWPGGVFILVVQRERILICELSPSTHASQVPWSVRPEGCA